MPKGLPKASPKSMFGRSGARLLRFWEEFWGVWNFMSFRSAKSRLNIIKDGDMGRPTGATVLILERVGGTRRCQQRLLESDRIWQESAESVSNALLPARGAADLKAKASCRRPQIYKKNTKIWKMSKMKIVKNSSFLKVSGKMDCRFEFSVIFYIFQHRSKLIFDIFSRMTFFQHENR